jgi:DNA-binding Lrp family transcriptional regulator
MLHAYVLLKFRRSPEQGLPLQEILKEIRHIQGIKEAHALFGDIDGIAMIEAQNATLLTAIIQHLSGISSVEQTDTRIVVP